MTVMTAMVTILVFGLLFWELVIRPDRDIRKYREKVAIARKEMRQAEAVHRAWKAQMPVAYDRATAGVPTYADESGTQHTLH